MSTSINTPKSAEDLILALQNAPMTLFQIIAVGLCVIINALDGFDVMVVAFTASPISREWTLSATEVGVLFSSGLVGMALGAVLVAPMGDRYGRRPLILGCQVVIGASMLATSYTHELWQFACLRAITGMAIGGLLASINIMVAEYSSNRRRTLCIGLMSLGYPIGAAVGGLISIYLIEAFSWRSVFMMGGVVSLVVAPFTILMLPESLSFKLLGRRPTTLLSVNKILKKMKHPLLTSLPAPIKKQTLAKSGFINLFRGRYAITTVLMGLIYMGTMLTVYFTLNWTPKILTSIGFTDASGISASLLMNITGACACLIMGVYASKFGLRRLAGYIYIGMFMSVVWFGLTPTSNVPMLVAIGVMGFFLFSTIAVSYAIVPEVFPTEIRLTGMGACLAFGRIGGVLGPYLAGVMIDADWSRSSYCFTLSTPIILAVVILPFIKFQDVTPQKTSLAFAK